MKRLERFGCFANYGGGPCGGMLAMAEGMIVPNTKFVSFPARAGWLAAALIGLAAALLGAPETASAAAGRIAIESGGLTRTAILVQHRRLKQGRRPVVVILRAGRDKSARLRRIFGLEEMARSSGPILLYPDPVAGRWSDAPGAEANRDAVFIRDLIAKLVSEGIADRRKVFIIGISNGGMMALRLVCDNAMTFAGAAAVITGMPADLAATCKPARPIPFMIIAGTADPLIPYNGGKADLPQSKAQILPLDATLAIFGKAAGCGEGRTTTPFPDRDPHDGTRAYLDKLNGCKAPVEAIRIEGGGHSIPGHWSGAGFESARGRRNSDIESASLIWDFFRRLGG